MGIQKVPEIRAKYEHHFGSKLGAILHEIEKEWHQMNKEWIVFKNLFDTNQVRVDIMNDASGNFFRLFQNSIMCTTIMRAGRLMDPPQSCGKDNLSIQLLEPLVASQFQAKVKELVDDAILTFLPMKDWRNKLYAHNDLDTKLRIGTGLPELRPSDVQLCIDAIIKPLDFLNQSVTGTVRANKLISTGPTELEVLYLLDRGLKNRGMSGYPDWLTEDNRN